MESLYFIAILPPIEIQTEITAFKQLIAKKFGSTHALNAPPHITLHMPFKWKEKKSGQLMEVLRQLNQDFAPFEIVLKDFDFFEPRVVFVDVLENTPLRTLQSSVDDTCRKQLKINNGNYKDQAFHPHVTIGFRDLKKPMFYQAKEAFERMHYERCFSAKELQLLQHNAGKWELVFF